MGGWPKASPLDGLAITVITAPQFAADPKG